MLGRFIALWLVWIRLEKRRFCIGWNIINIWILRLPSASTVKSFELTVLPMLYGMWGQEKLRPLWRSYTRCTDGIIFVVDSTKEDRLEEAKLELLKICKSNNKAGHIPVLVLANKQDLPSALDETKLEAALGLKELGPGALWHLQPTCAVTGEGLDEGMEVLHSMILQKRRLRKGMSTSGLIKPSSTNSSAAAPKTSRKVQRSHSHHVLSRWSEN